MTVTNVIVVVFWWSDSQQRLWNFVTFYDDNGL